MSIRKTIALFLAFFILMPNLGLALNVHYCHNEIASISIKNELVELLNPIDISCCSSTENCGKCCSNEVVELEKNKEVFFQDFSSFKSFPVVMMATVSMNLNWSYIGNIKKQVIENLCEANAPPLYKLYSQYIFYA
jgi:hypothetical protein